MDGQLESIAFTRTAFTGLSGPVVQRLTIVERPIVTVSGSLDDEPYIPNGCSSTVLYSSPAHSPLAGQDQMSQKSLNTKTSSLTSTSGVLITSDRDNSDVSPLLDHLYVPHGRYLDQELQFLGKGVMIRGTISSRVCFHFSDLCFSWPSNYQLS